MGSYFAVLALLVIIPGLAVMFADGFHREKATVPAGSDVQSDDRSSRGSY